MDTKYFDKKAEHWDAAQARVQRAEKIYRNIAERITLHGTDSVLDFGCGTGLLGFHFAEKAGTVTFADTSAGMLEQIVKKAELAGITNYKTLNVAENEIAEQYHIIVSLMALHHIEDTDKTVRRLADRLCKGGFVCFSDLDVEDGSFHYPDVAPHNGIDRSTVTAALAARGVTVIYNETVHIDTKTVNGQEKEYPVFLIIGRHEAR